MPGGVAPVSLATEPPSPINVPAALPPRFWWLKRLAAATLLWAAVMYGLWAWWHAEADRRLSAEIAAIRARGEPILPEDFARAAVAEDQDGTLDFAAAGALQEQLNRAPTSGRAPDWIPDPQDAWPTNADAIFARYANAIATASRASTKPAGRFPVTVSRPLMRMTLSYLPAQSDLARTLDFAARYDQRRGNSRAALELVALMLYQANAVDRTATFNTEHTVACRIRSRAATVAATAAASLSLEDPAARAAAERTIALLLDESDSRDGWVHGMQGERAGAADLYESFCRQFRLAPLFELDAARLVRRRTQFVEAARRPTYPAAVAALPAARDPAAARPVLERLSRTISDSMSFSTTRGASDHFTTLADTRLAAALLAERLYETDHAGRRPPRLSDLVPRYLRAVPTDPFAGDARPVSYRADGTGVRVYSIGPDGVDDGGTAVRPGRRDTPLWLRPDIVQPPPMTALR